MYTLGHVTLTTVDTSVLSMEGKRARRFVAGALTFDIVFTICMFFQVYSWDVDGVKSDFKLVFNGGDYAGLYAQTGVDILILAVIRYAVLSMLVPSENFLAARTSSPSTRLPTCFRILYTGIPVCSCVLLIVKFYATFVAEAYPVASLVVLSAGGAVASYVEFVAIRKWLDSRSNLWERPPSSYVSLNSHQVDREPLLSSVDREKAEDETKDGEEKKKEEEEESSLKEELGRIARLSKSDVGLYCVAFFFLVLAALAELAIPNFSSGVLASVAPGHESEDDFHYNCMMLAIAGASCGIFTALRGTCFSLCNNNVVARLRLKLFCALLGQEIAYFDTRDTGELTSRLTSDTTAIANVLGLNVNVMLRQSLQVIGGVVYMIYLSWELSMVSLGGFVIITFVGRTYGAYVKRRQKEVQDKVAEANKVAEQALSLMRVVRAFSSERWEVERYRKWIEKTLRIQNRISFVYGCYQTANFTTSYGVVAIILFYGGNMVLRGEMSGDLLTKFVFYAQFVSNASTYIGDMFTAIMQAIGASSKVFEMIERESEMKNCSALEYCTEEDVGVIGFGQKRRIASPEKTVNASATDVTNTSSSTNSSLLSTAPVEEIVVENTTIQGHIQLKGVVFRYPTRKEVTVLNGVSLDVQPGECVALVGLSGGGKSTIINLITRFYDPAEGSVFVDGKPLQDWNICDLHRNISVVNQEPQLFAVTIEENIAYGMKTYDIEKVHAAAKAANAHQFISALPNGYKTLVGERGVAMSGGQKQRIAIARALMRNPQILLLDEATSALDAESEQLVQQALDVAMRNRTVVVIAHRLSTIQNADKICVMKGGKIAEMGSHEDLLEQQGVYYGLVKRQLQHIEE